MWQIGVLAPGSARPGTLPTKVVDAFRSGMRDLGYIEGRNIRLETRWDEGRPERYEPFARDLVRLGVHVIIAGTTDSTIAAKNVTTTIPIVMAATGADPVALRLVASVSQPGIGEGEVVGQFWKLLKDPELDKLVQDAQTANKDLARAAASLRASRAAARLAGFDFFPTCLIFFSVFILPPSSFILALTGIWREESGRGAPRGRR